MNDVVITAALRTAVGKFNGSIAKVPAAELGAHVIRALLKSTGVRPDQISEVIMGQVLTAGVGQNPARQALIHAGLPDTVPGMTLGKVCGSGLKATHLAAQAIKCGDAEILIAGMGSVANEATVAADILRAEGLKVGVVGIRVYRPFPAEDVRQAFKKAKAIHLFEKAISY